MYFHGIEEVVGGWTTPYYITIPILIYVSEKIYTLIMSKVDCKGNLKCKIISVRFMGVEQNIVELKTRKPDSFKYVAGSYAFIKIPEISTVEWHPFTIASSPNDEYLLFLIKNNGDWTSTLIDNLRKTSLLSLCTVIFSNNNHWRSFYTEQMKQTETEQTGDSTINIDFSSQEKYISQVGGYGITSSELGETTKLLAGGLPASAQKLKPPKLEISGPIASPAANYRTYKHGLYIAAGIGITPYISILKTLKEKRDCCESGLKPISQTGISKLDEYANSDSSSLASRTYSLNSGYSSVVGDEGEVNTILQGLAQNDKHVNNRKKMASFMKKNKVFTNTSSGKLVKAYSSHRDIQPENVLHSFKRHTLVWSARSLADFQTCSDLLNSLLED
eukprot:Pgem_evm2s11543